MPVCTVPQEFVPFLDVDAVDKKQVCHSLSQSVSQSVSLSVTDSH